MKAVAPPSALSKNVGIWIRVSTDDQAQGESPQHHEHRARLYAESKSWVVKEVYDLAGVSGKSVMDHPETQRMLRDIKRGHIGGLIFSKLARLARNTKELLEFSDIFQSSNADLISLSESIDTSTPAGRLFYTMIAAMATWEREEIAERVRASVAIRAKLGLPLSAVCPYGYYWNKEKKLVPQPEEAPIRKLAYELFLEHRRKGAVARMLNEKGFRTRKKYPWTDMAVGRILVDTTARGEYRYFATKRVGPWKSQLKPESEAVTLSVEPIVSEELWHQVNQIIEAQTKKLKRPGKKPVHLFGGKVVCHCGAKMYVPSNTPKYICGKCRNKIPVIDMEGIFYDELKEFFTNSEAIAGHLLAAHNTVSEKRRLLDLQKSEIGKVRGEMKRTHELYLAGQIPLESFGQYHKPLEERLMQLQSDLPKLEAEIDFLNVNSLSADQVLSEANTLYSLWPKMATEEKRKIVEAILEKAVIGKDNEIELTLSYLPTSEELLKSQQTLSAALAPASC